MDTATPEETALAYALWDSTSTEKLCRPDDLAEKVRQARVVIRWLHVHGAAVTEAKRVAELEAALRPFAALGARMLAPDETGSHTLRVRVSDVRAAQRVLDSPRRERGLKFIDGQLSPRTKPRRQRTGDG